jgi:hypothetical protein
MAFVFAKLLTGLKAASGMAMEKSMPWKTKTTQFVGLARWIGNSIVAWEPEKFLLSLSL